MSATPANLATRSGIAAAAAAFDALAPTYDRFSQSLIGSHMRTAVRRRMLARFRAGDRVLELNCGTGDDAVWLAEQGMRVLATDVSARMLEAAESRVLVAGLQSRVEVQQIAIEEIDASRVHTDGNGPAFDGVLSNFGGLNCVSMPLGGTFARLAGCVRTGGFALFCVMGPRVPWEWLWYLGRRQPHVAFRRMRPEGTMWRGVRVMYPSIRTLTRASAPWFVPRRVAAIGALVPPSYAEDWARRHPRMLASLERLERRAETVWPLPSLADHYLIELERTAITAPAATAADRGNRCVESMDRAGGAEPDASRAQAGRSVGGAS